MLFSKTNNIVAMQTQVDVLLPKTKIENICRCNMFYQLRYEVNQLGAGQFVRPNNSEKTEGMK